MRKLIFPLTLIIFCSMLSCSEGGSIKSKIIGKWATEGCIIKLEFLKDGTIILIEESNSTVGNYKFIEGNRIRVDFNTPYGARTELYEASISKEELMVKGTTGEIRKLVYETTVKKSCEEMEKRRRMEIQQVKTEIQIKHLQSALELYKLDSGSYPTTDQGLQALVEKPTVGEIPKRWHKGVDKVPKDEWGNNFVYMSPGGHGEYDLYSLGADGKEGGEAENADVKGRELY